ncbi:MAG: hypothetical protein Tsb0034_21040 [Ekhidna sp.]
MTLTSVYSKALDTIVEVGRIIGHIKGKQQGPTLIFMGGIHGNEPAGVIALKRVVDYVKKQHIRGNIYAIAGNLAALGKSQRYIAEDLNRVWTRSRMERLPVEPDKAENQDVTEQIEINNIIQDILKKEEGPFYFFDIHTTSSETLPFLTVNDSLMNRYFTEQYPLPIILGIEEYLDGPILSWINELGYVAFGFEAGQHDDMASVENAQAFILLSMIYADALDKDDIEWYKYHDLLAKTTGDIKNIYEIIYRHEVKEGDKFHMLPGFYNFQKITKSQLLARSNGQEITAPVDGRIFMPLYQSKGEDGFFAIKKIWKPFLQLSAFIRKHRLDRVLAYLPGVKWMDEHKSCLLVNRHIARFMAKDIFHLFGFRSVQVDDHVYKMYNREAAARIAMYEREYWFEKQ